MRCKIEKTAHSSQGFKSFLSANRHHVLKGVWQREIIPTQMKLNSAGSSETLSNKKVVPQSNLLDLKTRFDNQSFADTEGVRRNEYAYSAQPVSSPLQNITSKQSDDISQVSKDLCTSGESPTEGGRRNESCPEYISTGKCPRSDRCEYLHRLPKDNNTVCRSFQRSMCSRTAKAGKYLHKEDDTIPVEDSVGLLLSTLKKQKTAVTPSQSEQNLKHIPHGLETSLNHPEQVHRSSAGTGFHVRENNMKLPSSFRVVQTSAFKVAPAADSGSAVANENKEIISLQENTQENISKVNETSNYIHRKQRTGMVSSRKTAGEQQGYAGGSTAKRMASELELKNKSQDSIQDAHNTKTSLTKKTTLDEYRRHRERSLMEKKLLNAGERAHSSVPGHVRSDGDNSGRKRKTNANLLYTHKNKKHCSDVSVKSENTVPKDNTVTIKTEPVDQPEWDVETSFIQTPVNLDIVKSEVKSEDFYKSETFCFAESSDDNELLSKKVNTLTEITKTWLDDIDENFERSGNMFHDLCQLMKRMGIPTWRDDAYPEVYTWEVNMRIMIVEMFTKLDVASFKKRIHECMRDQPDIRKFYEKCKSSLR